MPTLVLTGGSLTREEVEGVARGGVRVRIGPAAARGLAASRRRLESFARDGRAHYGVNTGFGSLARQRVPDAELRTLQRNLVRSHAAGAGAPLAGEIVRATMLLLAASLCRGVSGVRPVVVSKILGLLNSGVTPVVPEIGSVGASGDLAPLAHISLVLIGEGEAEIGGRRMGGGPALRRAGLRPLTLEAKEGLALINGTHLMAAQAALALCEFDRLFRSAMIGTAMSMDAWRATDAFLGAAVYRVRNQPGAAMVARELRGLLAGSRIILSHREGDTRVQDPYSLRCAPVVLGAAWDAADYVKRAVSAELGAVTDNPLVLGRGPRGLVSAGNFHGMPVALPLDVLAIAAAHIAGIAERRVYLMLSASEPESELRPYLSPRPGLHSGLMIAQYTAAACCNEIVGLTMPASPINLPTSSGMEDYNSFGPRSAAKARRAIELARRVVAIELACAAEGLEYHRPLRSGAGVERAYRRVRSKVARLKADRTLSPDIAAVEALIESGVF